MVLVHLHVYDACPCPCYTSLFLSMFSPVHHRSVCECVCECVFVFVFVCVFVFVFVCVFVCVFICVFVCINAGLSGIISVRYRNEKTNDAGNGPLPDQAKAIRHFFGPVQD